VIAPPPAALAKIDSPTKTTSDQLVNSPGSPNRETVSLK